MLLFLVLVHRLVATLSTASSRARERLCEHYGLSSMSQMGSYHTYGIQGVGHCFLRNWRWHGPSLVCVSFNETENET
jgi:hypothetical protein